MLYIYLQICLSFFFYPFFINKILPAFTNDSKKMRQFISIWKYISFHQNSHASVYCGRNRTCVMIVDQERVETPDEKEAKKKCLLEEQIVFWHILFAGSIMRGYFPLFRSSVFVLSVQLLISFAWLTPLTYSLSVFFKLLSSVSALLLLIYSTRDNPFFCFFKIKFY